MAKLTKAGVAAIVAEVERQLAPVIEEFAELRPQVAALVKARESARLAKLAEVAAIKSAVETRLAKAEQIAAVSHAVATIRKAVEARFWHFPKADGLRVSSLAN